MSPYSLLVLALSLVSLVSPAGSAPDDGAHSGERSGESWVARGDSLRTARAYDEALEAYGHARDVFVEHGAEARARQVELEGVAVLLRAGDARAALERTDDVIARSRVASDSTALALGLYWKGRAHDTLGRDRRAIPAYEELAEVAAAIGDSMRWGLAETYLARWARHDGDLDRAAERLARSNAIFLRIGADSRRATNLLLEGLIAMGRDRPDEARDFWMAGVEASKDFNNPSIYINCMNNIAVFEAVSGDPAVALECWQAARQTALDRERWRDAIRPTLNLAGLLSTLGRRTDAIELLEEARELAARHGFADLEGEVTLQLATTAQLYERFGRSIALYRRAHTLLADRGDADDRFMVRRGIAMSFVELDSAAAARRALEPVVRERDALSPRRAVALDAALAQVAQAEGRPAEALEIAGRALRASDVDEDLPTQLTLLEVRADAYEALDRPDSVVAALQAARDLYERFRQVPTDPTWREQRSAYAYRVVPRLAGTLLEGPDADPASVHALLQAYKARTLLERLTRPGETVPVGDDDVVPLHMMQQEVLRDGEAFLDLYAGENRSLLFVVARDVDEVVVLPGARELAERLSAYGELVRDPAAPDDAGPLLDRAAANLFDELLAPARALVPAARRWVVSLDGPFTALPLAALVAPVAPELEIVRVPSAQVLARLRSRADPTAGTAGVLALVPRGAAEGLPGSLAEADALRDRFEGVEVRTLGDDPDALEPLWTAPPAVLHVAGHARTVESDPWRSAILFDAIDDPAVSDPTGDRRAVGARRDQLRALEIVDMDIATPLVVLSGCSTLGGELFAGAGVLGLSSAFLVAGAREVLATLWPVDDGSTRAFMDGFYHALAEGHTPAAALARARQRLRDDPRTAHPFHWAGFVLVGDDSSAPSLRPRATSGGRAAMGWLFGALFGAALLAVGVRRANSR